MPKDSDDHSLHLVGLSGIGLAEGVFMFGNSTIRSVFFFAAKAFWLLALIFVFVVVIASPTVAQDAHAATGKKMEAAIACLNRLSERAMASRSRYIDWASDKPEMKKKPRNVLGLYTIYETDRCAKGVAEAASATPNNVPLEEASAGFVKSVQSLEPLLKDADDYYTQENYKDDKFAKGRDMHGKLLAAWDDFRSADNKLRSVVQEISDVRQAAELVDVEKRLGRTAKFQVMNTFLHAKALARAQAKVDMDKMDLAQVNELLATYETAVKELEAFADGQTTAKIDSFYINDAKNLLVTAKGLMRRVRDKTGFDAGEQMMLDQPGSGWMVEGSQPRLIRDFNELVANYNRM